MSRWNIKNHLKFIASNSHGMSIVEVVVASGIMLIIGIGVVSLMSSQQKSNKNLEYKLDVLNVEGALARLLSDDSNCACMFNGISFSSSNQNVNLNKIPNGCQTGPNNSLVTVGAKLTSDSSIIVQSIALANVVDSGVNQKSSDLIIEVTNPGMAIIKPIKIPARQFRVNSGGSITSCTMESSPTEKCANSAMIYIGIGNSFNGSTANTDGCVPYSAFQGATGLVGATGAVGPIGPAGPAGATGAVGPIGPAGPAGATGAVGPIGPAGPAGATGATGPPGPAGGTGGSTSGTVTGGGTCTPYTTGPCAGQCGGGSSGCASTWSFYGTGKSGGCQSGNTYQDTSNSSSGTYGFLCLAP